MDPNICGPDSSSCSWIESQPFLSKESEPNRPEEFLLKDLMGMTQTSYLKSMPLDRKIRLLRFLMNANTAIS
jgi:hypothetical protein